MSKKWPQKISRHYRQLIDRSNLNDPLARMLCFNLAEEDIKVGETDDPIGDKQHKVFPGLIHRYPSTVLILTTNRCCQNCRFCFRKNLNQAPFKLNWLQIVSYLKNHPKVWEVIFSGGDPLTLDNSEWQQIITELKDISHIKSWRLHSRLPIADPLSLKNDFFKLWSHLDQNLSLVIHTNHPKEISPATIKLVNKFKKNKWAVLSQSVLLKSVNDNQKTLKQLFSKLWQIGIKPYYLHHLDQAKGTSHFRVSIPAGLKLYQRLRGQIPGICLPQYVVDLPGGHGKVPVSWLKKITPRTYQVKNFQNKTVLYKDLA